MTGLLALLACACLGIAAYNLTCDFINVPTAKTSRMMLLSRKQQGVKADKLVEVYITRISTFFAKFVKLDRLKRGKLQAVLDITGTELSPEVYTMKAYVTSGLAALCSAPLFLIQPLFALVGVGIAVTLWFSTYYTAFDFVKKRKKIIEAEIPRFAMTVAQSLENDRDVVKLLTAYRKVSGKELGKELDHTIAEMKTGNYENALIHFEGRVGSALISDVVRGLIGTLRGDDQRLYFKMICFDMRQLEQHNLQKEAAKRPRKIQKYSMMMLICIILIYLVVLCMEVIGSLGAFFG